MKQGRTLVELAQELERRRESKHDYIARGEALHMYSPHSIAITNGETKTLQLNTLAKEQLASRLNIPKKYYDYLETEHPDLLVKNVNYLFPNSGQNHLVRTLDDKARAILSDRFRCLDDAPFVESILPVLLNSGFEVVSSELTDTRMYLKVISPKLIAEVKKGDVVTAGYWFRNSEVGHSRLAGGLFLNRLVCTNGMMMSKEYGFAKNHSGKALDFSEAAEAYYTNATRALDEKAYFAKLRDVVNGMIGSENGFKAAIAKFREASQEQITGDPVKAIEAVTEVFSLNKDESCGVLQALIKGADLSRWGVANALTAYSQTIADYDRATDFESFGGQIIELPRSDWQEIAVAA
jgi:hypothetical protein